MKLIETNRLLLRPLTLEDAPFAFELVNEPAWLRFIGDRQVRTLDDARRYIEKSHLAHYARFGFGHSAVVRKSDGALLGICGLLKRDALDDADLGFAFLERHRGAGYAHEAAAAVLSDAAERLGRRRIVGLTALDNERSGRLLEKLGFRFERIVQATHVGEESRLFVWTLEDRGGTGSLPA